MHRETVKCCSLMVPQHSFPSDPTIKRTICKSCDTLLLPGITATHRMRGTLLFSRNARLISLFSASREKHLVVRCLTCGEVKRFLAREGYKLWSERFGVSEDVEPVAKEVETMSAAVSATTTTATGVAAVGGPSATDTTPSTSSSATATIDSSSIATSVSSSSPSQSRDMEIADL